MRKKTKSQAILAYVALIAFVVTTLIVMSGYIQSKIQGTYKMAGDVFAEWEAKEMYMINKKYVLRLTIILTFLIVAAACPFYVFSQNFNLMPAATRIVDKQSQSAGAGLFITSYQFQSRK